MNYKECLKRLSDAVEMEMDRQIQNMIANGGIMYYANGNIRYDLPSIREVRNREEDQIHRDLDFLVLREQITEGQAEWIKDRL